MYNNAINIESLKGFVAEEKTMAKYRRITIEWSYPIEINSILEKESMNDKGIYYISRKFGDKESILYIGKTTDYFGRRLWSHYEDWLDKYKGKKSVRLGRIVSPLNISQEELNTLINDAEKTIIFYLSNTEGCELIANIKSTRSINCEKLLKIKNIGFRGSLPEELFIPDYLLVSC